MLEGLTSWQPPQLPDPTADQRWSELAKDAWRQGQAASDPAEARRWLERARRMAPTDDTVALGLAAACLRGGDAAAAQVLFGPLARRLDLAEAWLGLAVSALRPGDTAQAAAAMQAVLSRHAASVAARSLAASVAQAAALPGWCAVDGDGVLHADGPADLVLDGVRIAAAWSGGCCRLPPGDSLAVTRGGTALLGSPIDRSAIDAVDGCVGMESGGLLGWAWHPHNPDRDPVLLIGGRRVVATQAVGDAGFGRPLARLRRFFVAASELPAGPVAVTTQDGRRLRGSPVEPALRIVRSDVQGWRPAIVPARQPVDVVIPVHDASASTLRCLDAVLATLPDAARVCVVDDASRDPALAATLDRMAADGRIVLHRRADDRGVPDTGLAATPGRDMVLLDSDAVVPPGWLAALADAAYSAADIGSACPLSNDAGILSYPKRTGGNPMHDLAAMAGLARQANGPAVIDIPVAAGSCMFIRHDCLRDVGLLREDAFAQGYGEEDDWSLRARRRGWRHVAATGCFVAHEGAASFGTARTHLLARNTAVPDGLHPGHDALVGAWIERDPLGPTRRRMDAVRWHTARRPSAVVLVTHAGGGGVDRVVRERAAALQAAGIRPVLLRPAGDLTAVGGHDTPNLRFRLPDEWDALLRLLRPDRIQRVELHHMLGHPPALLTLAERLGAEQAVFIHDYASLCARITLVAGRSYCGEPPVSGCVACVAEHGSHSGEPVAPAALLARSAALLAASSRIVVPSFDTARRIRRHFSAVTPIVERLEDDSATPPPGPVRRPVRHLCIVGAIGIEKGYEVLLGCVADAASRHLPLRYTVVGFTSDDARLLAAGPVFVTGRFEAGEAEALIRQQDADLAFIPSIWPETWCFALGEAWRAGLQAVVFDLGAPAERVRRTGWGFVLPLGLSPPAINDWLLRGGPGGAPTRTHARFPGVAPSPSPRNPANGA